MDWDEGDRIYAILTRPCANFNLNSSTIKQLRIAFLSHTQTPFILNELGSCPSSATSKQSSNLIDLSFWKQTRWEAQEGSNQLLRLGC